MARETQVREAGIAHAAHRLPSVIVDHYNIELKDGDGFIGDGSRRLRSGRCWKRAARPCAPSVPIPWATRRAAISRSAASTTCCWPRIPSPLEPYGAPSRPSRRNSPAWFRSSCARRAGRAPRPSPSAAASATAARGCLAIGRAAYLLRAQGLDITLEPIRHHPDEGGLIGAVHLAPAWIFSGYDSLLAVDIGAATSAPASSRRTCGKPPTSRAARSGARRSGATATRIPSPAARRPWSASSGCSTT